MMSKLVMVIKHEREGSQVIPGVRTIMEKHNAKDRRDKRGLTAKRRAAPAVGGDKRSLEGTERRGKGADIIGRSTVLLHLLTAGHIERRGRDNGKGGVKSGEKQERFEPCGAANRRKRKPLSPLADLSVAQ